METGRKAPCPCGSGKQFKRCCGDPGRDRDWVYAHAAKAGELSLYGTLAEDWETQDPAEFWKAFRAVAEEYLGGPPDRARVFQARVDGLLDQLLARDQRFGYPPPHCHRGCANCCHEPVYCTSEEAELILEHCRQRGIAIDREKLARQLNYLEVDERGDHTGASRWNDQDPRDQACAFLDPVDRACTIWEVRPLVCRVHLAEATDEFCRPFNGVSRPEVRGITHPEWSLILSVLFTIHRDSIRRTLGRLLLALPELLPQEGHGKEGHHEDGPGPQGPRLR